MIEKSGHFEKGIWVEDKPPAAPQATGDTIDKKLSDATRTVISSIDTMMSATHNLVATPEGKQLIETTIKDAQKQFQLSFDAIVSRAKAELDKTKLEFDKTRAELDKRMAELDTSAIEPAKIKAELDKKVAELNKKVSELSERSAGPVEIKPALVKTEPVKPKAKSAKTKSVKTKTQPKKK